MPASVPGAPRKAGGLQKSALGAAPSATAPAAAAAGAAGGKVPGGGIFDIISNRIAEFAENMTIVERQQVKPEAPPADPAEMQRRKPRKLEIRLQTSKPEDVAFSAPFLDNTLQKMLTLQDRMLRLGAEIAKAEDVSDEIKKEQFAEAAEMSRIIALICAEKARQSS